MGAVWAAPTAGLLRDATLFDIYRPKPAKDPDGAAVPSQEKSMAVRLTLNSEEATLTEDQIDGAVQADVEHVLGVLEIGIGALVQHEGSEAAEAGGLQFQVMITRGGAVRWFRVGRQPPPDAGLD